MLIREIVREARWITDPEAQLRSVKQDPESIADIKNPSAELQIIALRAEPNIHHLIRRADPAIWSDPEVKARVMRQLLVNIKHRFGAQTKDLFQWLKQNRCPWPELSAIERSLGAGDSLINEITSDQFGNLTLTISDFKKLALMLQKSKIATVTNKLAEIGMVLHSSRLDLEIPDLSVALTARKTEILKHLLGLIKTGEDSRDKEDIEHMVEALNDLGVDWPELHTINIALDSLDYD